MDVSFGDPPICTGILGKYLKPGKSSAEAVSGDEIRDGANDEVVTRTLLYGWLKSACTNSKAPGWGGGTASGGKTYICKFAISS